MMILRKGTIAGEAGPIPEFGPQTWAKVSDAGGLGQYGAYVITLQPGSRSSNRHWHDREDEFLYMLEGEAVVVENDGEASTASRAATSRAGPRAPPTPIRCSTKAMRLART